MTTNITSNSQTTRKNLKTLCVTLMFVWDSHSVVILPIFPKIIDRSNIFFTNWECGRFIGLVF